MGKPKSGRPRSNGTVPPGTLPQVVVAVASQAHRPLPSREQRAHSPTQTPFALHCILDPDGTVVAMPDQSGEVGELTRGQKFWDCFPGRLNQQVRKQVRAACRRAAGGQPVREELSLLSNDTPRIIQLQITPVRDAEGRVSHLIPWVSLASASATDAHDFRQAQQDRASLAAIVDSTADAVISKTLQGYITSWNLAAQRLFGYAPAEAIGQHISLIIPPELMDEEATILDRLQRGERIDHYETERVARDGRRILISLTISPMLDGEGRIIGASKVARDITERRRSEATLARRAREQAALYQFTDQLRRARSTAEIHEAALDAIISALGCQRASILLRDDAGAMRFVAWRGLSDEYRSAVEGHSPWNDDEVDPQPVCVGDVACVELSDRIRAAVNAEGIRALAFIPLVCGGALLGKFMAYYTTPHSFSSEDADLGLLIARQLAFSLDRLWAAETNELTDQALRESQERFARFMTHLPGLAWIKDLQGRYVYANSAAADAFGISADSLYQKTDNELFPAQTAAAFARHDAEALRSPTGIQTIEALEHPDGQLHHSLVNKFRIPGTEPTKDLVGGMAIDITAMKRAEEALRERETQYRELSGRLELLLQTTSRLIETLEPAELFSSVLNLARDLVSADAFGVWRIDEATQEWRLIDSQGLSDEFTHEARQIGERFEIPAEPIIVQPQDMDAASLQSVAQRRASFKREGIRSFMALPMRIHGEVSATLGFYCHTPHRFTDIEIESAQAMANIAAAAITKSELYETQLQLRLRAEAAARRETFLAEAGAILSESFNHKETLFKVATAAVPRFADWCCVDLFDDSGSLQRLVDAHSTPDQAALAREMREKYPPGGNTEVGIDHVIRTGQAELLSSLPDSLLDRAARDRTHRRFLHDLHPTSQICIPLRCDGAVCGAMSFVTTKSGRRYDESDLAVAQEIARRAAQAIENARLYRELSESEQRLRLALDAGQMGSWEWRIDSNEVIWSPGLERIHGLECGTFGGTFESFERDIHPADMDRVRESIQQTLASGREHQIEYRIIRPDGSLRWVEGRGKLFRNDAGDPVRMIGVCMDVSARRDADEALRESERRFREMIDALPAAVYTTDADGYLTHFNPAAARFAGRTPRIGADRWCVTVKLFAADGTPMAHEHCPMAVALREGRPVGGGDVIAERPDGTRRWFQPHPTPLHDKDGRVVGGINMLVDITERRGIEEALRESEERYRRLVGLLPVAVYTCDSPSGLITFYNEQAAELWGQAPRVGDTDHRFCGSFKLWKPDGTPLPHDQTPMAIALREGRSFRHQDVIIERPDGSRINVLVNIDPVFNTEGQLVGAVNAFQDVTPHRQAEEALRESERRFRLMADAAPVLIWVSDENKRGIYFNQRWLAFTGRSHEQEIGDGWLQSIHPDDVLSVSTACRAAFERRAPFRVEFRMRRANGEYRWLLDHGVPRLNQAGDLAGYIGSCIDITEHREAEQALRQSEERFRELANGIDQFAWTSDPAGRATWFNQRWIDYTGCTLADARGEGWKKVHHPHHLQRIIQGQRAALAAGEPWEDVYPIRGRDGNYRWFLSRAMPIRDNDGQVIRWLGTNTDVTEQREAEEALRENERRMSTLLSNLPGMVYRYRYDEAWTVEFVSQGAQELTGYNPQEFVLGQRRWTHLIHSDDAGWVKEAVHTSMQRHEPFELEYRIHHCDGGERWVWEQGEAVFDESGNAIALEGFVTDITERRNAEQQLRESEGRFRRLANAAPVLIWISGTDKSFTWFNEPWLDFVGRSMEQEIGNGWIENVHPEDLDHCLGTYFGCFDARQPFTMEYRLRRHDGEYRWVLDHGIPMVGEHGAFTGYIGSCIDITERRRTEAALKSKEAELQLVASATPVILARCTRDMRYRFANRALAALSGKSPDELIGKSIPEVIGQAAFEKIRPYVDRVLAGETVEYETEVHYGSASARWVQVNYMPERDEQGDVVGWVASIIDITERRQAEEALRSSEARYKAAIDTALDCVITMDFNARITGFNPAAERTFGYSRDEVIGRELAEVLIPPELRGDHRRGMLRWREGQDSRLFGQRIETTGIRKDGSRILIEISMARTPGDPPSVTAFLRDVTEQKRVAESLRQSNEALERRVAERTAELQHRANQLARLTSELTLTERRERQRLARVLHDHLQQLLASGKLGLEFIARSSDDTRRAEWIEHARTCIDEAIEASRSLSVELCPPVLHESGLAAGCEWLARWMKEKHGLEVQLSVDPRANPDREDVRTLVFESIRELLFNTTKHAGVKKATLELRRHGGDRLCVIIRDRGAGFNPEQLLESREHIGYGLLNIRERLALLGGSFEIKSAVGEGSCFTLVAPRSGRSDLRPAAPEPLEAQTTKVAKLSARAISELDDRIRVMVVDDHAVMREGLCALLAEEPTLEVVGEASDGIEAIEQAKTLQPDIILMDYSMPSMNGVEATQVIRRDLPKVQVIALSMHREKERARAMIEAGAVAYFNKSDDSDALIKAIARFGSRATRSAEEPAR